MPCCRLLFVALFNSCASAQTQNAPTPQVVRIYDLAHLQPADLASAMSAATEIFARVGVRIDWTRGAPDEIEAHSLDLIACHETTLRQPEIRLRIIGKAPPGFQPAALGFALPCARFGVDATIFADRVMAVSRHLTLPFPAALGHAMAHELGHLFLGSGEHTPAGIMRAKWDSRDWRRVATSGLTFDATQAAGLRGRR